MYSAERIRRGEAVFTYVDSHSVYECAHVSVCICEVDLS